MKTLLIDIDDTCWGLLDAWIKWFNALDGTDLKPEDCEGWELTDMFKGRTEQEIFEPLSTDEFWSTVKAFPDAQKYIPLLQKLFNVKFVSASNFESVTPKMKYFLKQFPTVKEKDIVITADKSVVKGDILVDDYYKNLQSRKFPILFTAHHNKTIEGYPRCNSWKEVYQYLIMNFLA